jgi:hypothetical protein
VSFVVKEAEETNSCNNKADIIEEVRGYHINCICIWSIYHKVLE